MYGCSSGESRGDSVVVAAIVCRCQAGGLGRGE